MRLLRLELRNFVSYLDLDLDLAGVDKCALVGKTGAGKSSLQDAVLWSLFGRARGITNRAERLIHEGESVMRVTTRWSLRDSSLVVTRERDMTTGDGTSSFHLELDGEDLTRHTIDETQQVLERLIGIPYDGVLAGPLMVQGESDRLMALDPGPRKDLLMRCLGLDRYEEYLVAVKQAHVASRLLLERLGAEREGLVPLIEGEVAARHDLERARARRVEEAAELDRRQTAVVAVLGEINAQLAQITRQGALNRSLSVAQHRLGEAEREAADLELKAQRLQPFAEAAEPVVPAVDGTIDQALQTARQRAEAFHTGSVEASRVQTMLTHLMAQAAMIQTVPCGGEGIYASCGFLQVAESAREQLPALVAERARIVLELADLADAPARYQRLVDRRSQGDRELADAKLAHERWEQAKRAYGELPERRRLVAARISDLEREIEEIRIELRTLPVADPGVLTARRDALQRAARDAAADLASTDTLIGMQAGILASIEQAKRRVEALDVEIAKATGRQKVLEVLVRAFGRDGIPTLILENDIPAIEATANEALDRMPGGFRLALVTQAGTKRGTVSETLDVAVFVDGHERAYRLMSGGERLRIDVALRIAISAVLGDRFGTFWLDEPTGQDRDGRDGLLEVLSMLSDEFDLVICATHEEDLADRFAVRLVVSKENGLSAVEVAA